MAVNIPGTNNDSQQASSLVPPVKPTAAPTQQRPMNTYQGAQSMSVMSERNPAPLAGTPDAEAMKAFADAVKLLIGNSHDSYDLQMVNVSKTENTNLFCSAIAFVVRHKQAPNAALAFHTMLIGDTAGELPRPQVNINGKTVEQQWVIGDAYDNEFKAVVAGAIARQFPNTKPEHMFDAEAQVVPAGYDFKDLSLVRSTLANALRAAGTVLNSNATNFKDYSLEGSAAGLNSVATLTFNQNQQANAVGEPVRTDVYVAYAEVRGQAQQGKQSGERVSLNSGERSEQAFGIGGFMDLLWDPANPQVGQNPYQAALQQYQQQPQSTHLYTPRFVITKLDAKLLNTLPGQLLGLVTALTLRSNGNWIGSFRRPHTNEFDMRDIGAIGIEANLDKNPSNFGSRIDTRSESFTAQQLASLVQAFIRPNLAISMDVAECGPETWLTSVFLAAARGSADANEAILSAAQLLTNGKFNYAGAAVFAENNRIHMGYYVDKNGVKRDLRDVDYLAIANMFGETDPVQIREWSDTFTRTDYASDLRMHARRRILESAVGGSVFYTGFAERVTFSGPFLDALEKAVVATGLTIRPVTPFQDMTGPNRVSASWMQNLRLGTESSGLFNRGYAGAARPGTQVGGTFGRWSQ
jgi:hypothetical protein